MKFDSILGTVGNTPVVRINKLGPKGVNLYVKIEAFNPLGSVKDRLALGIIEAAERDGSLKPGQTIIEGSSGNTGLSHGSKPRTRCRRCVRPRTRRRARHPQFLTSLDSHQMVRPAAVPVRPVEKSRPKNRRQDHSCFVLHHRRAARCWRRPPYS